MITSAAFSPLKHPSMLRDGALDPQSQLEVLQVPFGLDAVERFHDLTLIVDYERGTSNLEWLALIRALFISDRPVRSGHVETIIDQQRKVKIVVVCEGAMG